jgi:hypothetical protein
VVDRDRICRQLRPIVLAGVVLVENALRFVQRILSAVDEYLAVDGSADNFVGSLWDWRAKAPFTLSLGNSRNPRKDYSEQDSKS